MKKILDSDWLRAMQLKCNTSANSVRCSIAVDQNILIGCYLFENRYFDILLTWNDDID